MDVLAEWDKNNWDRVVFLENLSIPVKSVGQCGDGRVGGVGQNNLDRVVFLENLFIPVKAVGLCGDGRVGGVGQKHIRQSCLPWKFIHSRKVCVTVWRWTYWRSGTNTIFTELSLLKVYLAPLNLSVKNFRRHLSSAFLFQQTVAWEDVYE